jgi:hypothetical protein
MAEIDAEIAAAEEAAVEAAEEAELEGIEGEATEGVESAAETDTTEDMDLGTLADLESFNTNGGCEILTEEQEILNTDPPAAIILTEDDLPSPTDLDPEKDFSENN